MTPLEQLIFDVSVLDHYVSHSIEDGIVWFELYDITIGHYISELKLKTIPHWWICETEYPSYPSYQQIPEGYRYSIKEKPMETASIPHTQTRGWRAFDWICAAAFFRFYGQNRPPEYYDFVNYRRSK